MSKTKVLITTGDVDGIGLEVTLKALQKIKKPSNTCFIFYRSPLSHQKVSSALKSKYSYAKVASLQEALNLHSASLIEVRSDKSPAHWVIEAAKACLTQQAQALVTGPLSKETIVEAGIPHIGHTGILKALTKQKDLYMGFYGDKFNVSLVTDHISLQKVSKNLTPEKILKVMDLTYDSLPATMKKRPLGVLGLNPHSGERGIIGHEELTLFSDLQKALKNRTYKAEFPLVPDAAFFEKNWKRYGSFICLYHDQGLIPFKMIHGQNSGVHMTLGLPFIRTSVDHGTAKDIFGKNKANPNSMAESLLLAVNLARQKNR